MLSTVYLQLLESIKARIYKNLVDAVFVEDTFVENVRERYSVTFTVIYFS